MKTLAKIKQDKQVAGVCSGFAYMMGVPTWIVRMSFVLAVLVGCGVPILAYALLWMFMPQWHIDPSDYAARTHQPVGLPDTPAPAPDVPATSLEKPMPPSA